MAIRYSADALTHLRDSPLCVKPSTLPPAEEWMGPPPDSFRNSQGNKPGGDRSRNNDSSLLEQTNRRLGVDRHTPRNIANPEDIILGPPRTTFSSTLSRVNKTFDGDKTAKDGDTRDRFAFRSRNGEADTAERFRDRGERDRDTRTNFRRRGDADQDSEGWSTVKPRKSFGHEGAERFHGRMGERPERFGGDRRRDQEDRENGERPRRAFGEFSKEKEGDEGEKPRKNGLTRNRADQPWLRDNEASTTRERFDRSKSWRERAADDQQGEAHQEKPRERTYDRRWDRDRDHRQEREPEWLDEPVEEQSQGHTQEDFKKFMESMKAGKNPAKAEPAPTSTEASALPEKVEVEKTKAKSAPAIEMMGPDKFFAAFAQSSNVETQGSTGEMIKENAIPVIKSKSGSRFQNFFSSQEESRRQPEPPAPVAPVASAPPAPETNPLLALAGAQGSNDVAEKVAFQALLQKLQKQTMQATPPPAGGFSEPPPNHIASPGPFQPYGQDRHDEILIRGPLASQDLHTPRPPPPQQYGAMRPEQQMLHELIGQRHPVQNQSVARPDQQSRNSNSNAEFLMTLMQGARAAPESQRNEQLAMRMPQPSRPAQILPTPDRELDFQHERPSQHQGVRPNALPSFFDEPPMHHREQDSRPQQPTQILQRQVLPGLEQVHASWLQNNAQQIPPPGRPMIPPPGLAGNPRNGPIPGGFPPNFAMGGFPPEAMAGPPRNMGPPPGFFGGPPPPGPGFMLPGMGGFQGPENVNVGFGFDHRGMPPPPGTFRRN
ncbi:hypothetical protein F4818DRAFT_412307 [Hypoxylon cercidicola]|nr:hypothetical protein F4818DRAFT_412307 [Hypoxylon cercidicola]